MKDLVKHILKDKTLKQKYWPNHVNNLCRRFYLPEIQDMFKHDAPTKAAFKKFANDKIKGYYSEKLKAKIQVSSSLRFIHPDDFDFQDKKISPLISTAYTRREVVAMKLNVLHLIGEYKCSENLFRLKLKDSKKCDYCEDDCDSSEHALIKCGAVSADGGHQKQLQLVIEWLSKHKSIPVEQIKFTVSAEFETFARWLINPLSVSNTGIFKLEKNFKGVCLLIKITQELILVSHNLRCKARKLRNVKARRTFKTKTRKQPGGKNGSGGLSLGRNLHQVASGKNSIKSYFSSNTNYGKVAKNQNDVDAMTFTAADKERMSKGGRSFGEDNGCQLVLMMTGGHINTIITQRCRDNGRDLISRNAVVRFHDFSRPNNIMVLITSQDTRILNSVRILTLGGMGPESISDITGYSPFLLGEVPQEKWDTECPAWLLYSEYEDTLTCHLLAHTKEHAHIHLSLSESSGAWSTMEKPYLHDDDWNAFENCQQRWITRRVEHLWTWACSNMKRGAWTIMDMSQKSSLKCENWSQVTRMLEMTSPGRSVWLSNLLKSSNDSEWPTEEAKEISAINMSGNWVHIRPPIEILGSICTSNGQEGVRYDNSPAAWADKRNWWPSRCNSPQGDKDMMRSMVAGCLDEVDILKTELTGLNRTCEQMFKTNICLQSEVNTLRKKLTDSEHKRYNVVIPQDAMGEREEKRILRIVQAVMNSTAAAPASERHQTYSDSDFSRDEDLERERLNYMQTPRTPTECYKEERETMPGTRKVQEVDTDEDKQLFLRAKIKLEAIEARKRKAAFEVNMDDASTPRPGTSASTMALGAPQGRKTPPVKVLANVLARMPESARTVPLPSSPPTAVQGMRGPPSTPASGSRPSPVQRSSGQGATGEDRKRRREESPLTLEEGHNLAKKLATAGAWLPTPVKTEPTEVEDESGMEIMRAEVIEDEEMCNSAEKEAKSAEADPPETRAAAEANNSTLAEQDLDLILNVEDHDLDFEPEEAILDNTVEVKTFNKLFSLRPDFRTRRRRIPKHQGSETSGCTNKRTHTSETDFIKMQKLSIYDFNPILIYYLYYLYHIGRAVCPQISIVIINDFIVCQ